MNSFLRIEDTDIMLIDGDRGVNYPSKNEFYDKEYCLFLDAKNVTENGFDFSETHFITKEKDDILRNGKLQRNDIVMMTRGSVGNVALYDEAVPYDNIRINSGMVIIRCNKKFKPLQIYYLLKSKLVQKQISDMMSGSVQKQLPVSVINKIQLPGNSIRIDIIYAIDKKIENNNKINKELESMAKTIYGYWFLQFEFPNENGKPYKSSGGKMVWSEELKREIPEGWEVKSIDDFGTLNNGINYSKNEVGDKNYKIVNVRNISETSLLLSKTKMDDIVLTARTADNYLIKKNDILIARSGIPGAVRILKNDIENTIYCGFIICLRLSSDFYRRYLVYKLKDYENTTATTSGGTIMQNVSQSTLKSIKFAVPEKKYILKFNEKIDIIWSNMQNNEEENQALISLRNFLLPLLTNGQIGFKDVM